MKGCFDLCSLPCLFGAITLVFALQACSDDAAPPTPQAEPERPPTLESDPLEQGEAGDDPLQGLEGPADPGEVTALPSTGPVATAETLRVATPDHGCVALNETPVRLWPRPGPPAIVAVGNRFVVGGYAPSQTGGEQLFLVTTRPESAPVPLRTVGIEPHFRHGARVAPPALAVADEVTLAVAITDGAGHVLVGDLDLTASGARLSLSRVGDGADSRFAPALAALARRRAVAWTARGETMRVKLALVGLDGLVAASHDVTPDTMGGAAPAFAAGVSPPWLLFVDARAGVSPIVGVQLGEDGSPEEAAVARPVGTVASPPELAAVRVGGRDWAAYTAVGNAATTAVGLLRIDTDGGPAVPLVPGTGYGVLNVAATGAPAAALFAADAPKAPPPGSPREIHLRVVDQDGPGPALVLAGPDGSARHAAVARRADGVVGVAFESGSAVYVAWARCDDQ